MHSRRNSGQDIDIKTPNVEEDNVKQSKGLRLKMHSGKNPGQDVNIKTPDIEEDGENQPQSRILEMHSGRNKTKRQAMVSKGVYKFPILKDTSFVDEIALNCVLDNYLDILDKWQQEVYEIRIAHHDIWKNSRLSQIIKQHRAGSRVESQTRILPPGKDTDVDYMFELSGILVNCDENRHGIYWIPSSASFAFGFVFVEVNFLDKIKTKYGDILTTESFEFDVNENAFRLLPNRFKENVVRASLFEFHEHGKASATSPSIAGKGAINEYDTVPCLKLSKWPDLTNSWILRGPHGDEFVFNLKWKEIILKTIPIFIVPTGNPLSDNKHKQFRLSFSMAEIKCFSQISPKMRKSYGIAKYVFKSLFCSATCELLSSYHIKTIFLWQCEQLNIKQWEQISPFTFIKIMFSEMKSCILKQNIQHFFISGCNIFPSHKLLKVNFDVYNDVFENETERIYTTIMVLLRSDLALESVDYDNVLATANSKLEEMTALERIERYISGYLTRLLSMITFSLIENDKKGKLMECVENVSHTFERYKSNIHLKKVISMINIVIKRLQTCNSTIVKTIPCCLENRNGITEHAHVAFELYLQKRYDELKFNSHQSNNKVFIYANGNWSFGNKIPQMLQFRYSYPFCNR